MRIAPIKESVSTSCMLFRPDHPVFGRVKQCLSGFEPRADLENSVDWCLVHLNPKSITCSVALSILSV